IEANGSPKFLFAKQYARSFVELLDEWTLKQGKTVWLEKTPWHVRHVVEIERLVPAPKFIHIVRNGSDVIASTFELAKKYPDTWGRGWSLDNCIDNWLADASISSRNRERPNHFVVRYERLVRDQRSMLERLCEF